MLPEYKPVKKEDLSARAKLIDADETSAQELSLTCKGLGVLEAFATADAATTFRLDVSPDNVTWITDYFVWSGLTTIKKTFWNGFGYVKLKSDAAGVAGNKVSLILAAAV